MNLWLSSRIEGEPVYSGLTLAYAVPGEVTGEWDGEYRIERHPSLLPPNATALELAVEEAMVRAVPIPIRELWDVKTCPDEFLPWLEWALHVDYPGATPAQKRALIVDSVQLHRTKGTRFALERALAPLGLSSAIFEWFEYDGNPYCFQVAIDVSDKGMSKLYLSDIEGLIHEYKNVRSHLENLRMIARTRADIRLGAATLSGETVEIMGQRTEDSHD
jgi:phage tail P2-like protein